MTRSLFLATTAVLAVAPVAYAQPDDGSDVEDVIIVTGSGTQVFSTEALQAADVLDPIEILERFDGSLGRTLADLPGINTTDFGPAVGRPIIRGLGGDRVRILQNGVGLIDASSISVDHAPAVDVLEAEKIEVLRGPAAIAYGGNAVGGVVNVVDGRIPSEAADGLVDGQLFAGYTSVDDGTQFAGRVRSGVGPVVFQVEGSRRDADDFDIPGFARSDILRAIEPLEDGEEEPRDTVENSDFTFSTVGGGASVVGDWGFFGVAVRSLTSEYGLPVEEEEEEEEPGGPGEAEEEGGGLFIDLDQLRVDTRGALNLDFGPFSQLTFSAGYSDYEHAEVEPNGEVGTLFENDGFELRTALVNEGPGPWSGTIGVQAFRTDFSAAGEEAFVPPTVTRDVAVFAAQRYDLDQYGFEGGVRVETRDLESDGVDAINDGVGDDRDFNTVSASVGAFVRPAAGVFAGLNFARTERAPTDLELFSNGPHAATGAFEVGDPNLDKETALSVDATFTLNRSGWRGQAGAFYTDYADFIFLAPTGGEDPDEGLPIFQFFQDDAMLWGGEAFLARDIFEYGEWTLVGDTTIEYVRGETDTLGDLPFIPPLQGIVGAELNHSFVDLRAEVEWVTEQEDTATFELPTDGFAFVNLSATARPFKERDIQLTVALLNLADEEGRLHTSQLKDIVPLAGRNVRVALSTRF